MNDFIDDIGQAAFGMTRTEALAKGVCIRCHKPVAPNGEYDNELIYSNAGVKEYGISAMCEKCFDGMFGAE